jgi:phosphate-selective porin OprO/OprP
MHLKRSNGRRSLKSLSVLALLAALIPAAALAQEKNGDLDARLKILERNWALQQESADAKSKEGAFVTADKKDGFSVKAKDGSYSLRLGAHLQVDSRNYVGARSSGFADQFLLRRARMILEATFNDFIDFRFMPDFAGVAPVIQDAYFDFKFAPEAKLRFGKFKVPVGLETLQSDPFTHFIERGLPSYLAPVRDVGVQVPGDVADGVLRYAVGLFNGAIDGGSADGDADRSKDAAARLMLQPFKKTESNWLEEFAFGVGGSYGRQTGAAPNLASYKTPAQQNFFTYTAGTVADGERLRFSPQAYWYPGSLGFQAEWTTSISAVRLGTARDKVRHRAWQVLGSWIVTGEKNSYKGYAPRRPFNPKERAWGSLELVARYGELNIDDAAIPRFASATASSRGVSSWAAGVNWYPVTQVKVLVDFEDSRFWSGSRPREQAVLSRVQLLF